MLFYDCTLPSGLAQLAGTQADAKKLDPSFKQIELADDKASRIAHINGLRKDAFDARTATANEDRPVPGEGFVKTKSDVVREFAERSGTPVIDVAIPDTMHPMPSKRKTLGEKLSNLTLSQIDEIMVRTTLEEAIWAMDETGLDKLAKVMEERRADLAAQTVAPTPAPRSRVRPS